MIFNDDFDYLLKTKFLKPPHAYFQSCRPLPTAESIITADFDEDNGGDAIFCDFNRDSEMDLLPSKAYSFDYVHSKSSKRLANDISQNFDNKKTLDNILNQLKKTPYLAMSFEQFIKYCG